MEKTSRQSTYFLPGDVTATHSEVQDSNPRNKKFVNSTFSSQSIEGNFQLLSASENCFGGKSAHHSRGQE